MRTRDTAGKIAIEFQQPEHCERAMKRAAEVFSFLATSPGDGKIIFLFLFISIDCYQDCTTKLRRQPLL